MAATGAAAPILPSQLLLQVLGQLCLYPSRTQTKKD